MTTCQDSGSERLPLDAGPGVEPGPGEVTTALVVDDAEPATWSLRRDLDVHGSIVRGLAHYLWGMRAELGRAITFGRVTETHADAWDESMPLPVAAVHGVGGEGSYSGQLSTSPVRQDGQPVEFDTLDGRAGLYQTGTYEHDRITAEILAASQAELGAIVAALEDMWSPGLDRGGFLLRLGHYHGATARYVVRSQARETVADEATGGLWIARFRITASAPVIRVHRRPRADLRVTVTAGVSR